MPTTSRCAVLSFLFAILLTGPLAAAEVKVDAKLGRSVLPTANPGSVYLRLSLKSLAATKRDHRTPINAAIVIDRSGSMQATASPQRKKARALRSSVSRPTTPSPSSPSITTSTC
jgi:hypothetical protein